MNGVKELITSNSSPHKVCLSFRVVLFIRSIFKDLQYHCWMSLRSQCCVSSFLYCNPSIRILSKSFNIPCIHWLIASIYLVSDYRFDAVKNHQRCLLGRYHFLLFDKSMTVNALVIGLIVFRIFSVPRSQAYLGRANLATTGSSPVRSKQIGQ